MESCIFCKIADHTLQAGMVYEDDQVLAFHDIHPQAPVHIIICPRKHIPTLNDLMADDAPILNRLFEIARKLAEQFKVHESGYRTVINVNKDAGQTVWHLHLHLIGGKTLGSGG